MIEYTYTFKGSKFTFVGKDSDSIWASVEPFLKRNNIKYNESLIKNHIRLTAKNAGIESNKESKPRKVSSRPGLRDAFQAAKALVNLTIGNAVDQPEAQRRADICLNCPMSSKTSDCMACGGSRVVANQASEISRMIKGRSVVPRGIKSLYCGVCSCSLSLLVMTKISGLSDKLDDPNRPDECWMKRNGVNFKKD